MSALPWEQLCAAPEMLQTAHGSLAAGRARIPVGTTYDLEDIVRAHQDMEAGRVGGKGVVLTSLDAS